MITRRQTGLGRQLLAGVAIAAVALTGVTPGAIAQPAPQQAADQGYTQPQLDALMAPVALYPDQLLTQVLMAAAYPDDVKAANDWLHDPANAQLQGDQLADALKPLPWQPAVKALTPFPQVLAMMVSQPDWMQQVGYAMNVQQPAVMASVQHLREQAEQAGHLQSGSQYAVSGPPGQIVIAPPTPEQVYVPVYDPLVVYGPGFVWGVRPYIWAAPIGFGFGPLVGGFAFSAPIGIVAPLWGFAAFHWGYGGGIFVNAGLWNVYAVGHPWGGGFWHPVGYGAFGRPAFGFRAGPAFHGAVVSRANINVYHNTIVHNNTVINHNNTVVNHNALPAVHRPAGAGPTHYAPAAAGYHGAAPAYHGAAPAFHAPTFHAPEAGAGGYHGAEAGGYHPGAAPGGYHPAAAAPRAPMAAPHPAAPRAPAAHGGGEKHR